MFLFSKLAGFFVHPLAWVLVLLGIGIFLQRMRRQAGSGIYLGLAFALLAFLSWEKPANLAMETLETQYRPFSGALSRYEGVVVLGGSTDGGGIAAYSGQVPLSEAAERLTEAAAVAKADGRIKILFTGFDGRVFARGPSEAQLALLFLAQQGVPAERIIVEDRARNTVENARLSAALKGVDPRLSWLLVTSAFHMPRSMQIFRDAGWNVTAYPVDFRADPSTLWFEFSFGNGVRLWNTVVREYAGRAAAAWQ